MTIIFILSVLIILFSIFCFLITHISFFFIMILIPIFIASLYICPIISPIIFVIFIIFLKKAFKQAKKEKIEEKEKEIKEAIEFKNQKQKVKLIHGMSSCYIEKEINKFIRDKKVINVTFDDNRGHLTATILYEDI